MIRLLVFLFALPALSLAQEERTFGNGVLPEYLAIYDVDDSGGLSREELQTLRSDRLNRQARLRNRWDTDGNGTISDDERDAAKAAIRREIEERRTRRFTEVDLNADGLLTIAEFRTIRAVASAENATPGVAQRIFNSLDGNENGQITIREFLAKLSIVPEVVPPPAPTPNTRTPLPPPPNQGPKE